MAASPSNSVAESVPRHKTALARTTLSRPVTQALEDGLISERTTVFDYGCGRGGDVERLRRAGYECNGWDPEFFPSVEPQPAAVVNLGYVINVIENSEERVETLRRAWALAERLLIVAVRLKGEALSSADADRCGDGVLTGTGTFQRLYAQQEIRELVDGALQVQSIAAAPGILYCFREPKDVELHLLTRVRKRRVRGRSEAVFDRNQELLKALMEFIENAGRLPRDGEFDKEPELRDQVGTPRQAFQVIKQVTGEERWDRARVGRYEDVLVYLALSRFQRRPRISDLPMTLQIDIKEFFGSYKAACEQADRVLFGLGEQSRVREAISAARVGKKVRESLYVHVSAIPDLPSTLRVLEGCAAALLGAVPDATLVRFDVERPRVGFLEYPDFDSEPHPALAGVYVVALDSLHSDYVDYTERDNPPIVHRKELFVAEDYALRERFARLTRQEAKAGLFADASRIGTVRGWNQALAEAGMELRGHRLVKVRSAK